MKISISDWNKKTGKQKVSIKIDSWDTYSLDYTLALILKESLEKFRECSQAYPGNLTEEEWYTIIDRMIEGFSIIVDKDCDWKRNKDEEIKVNEALDLFAEWYGHLWW